MTTQMPKRVARIRRDIECCLDFSGLRNGGTEAVHAWAATVGMNGAAVIMQWQAVGMRAQELGAARPKGVKTETRWDVFVDLDYWADAPDDGDDEPDDVDDDDEPPVDKDATEDSEDEEEADGVEDEDDVEEE